MNFPGFATLLRIKLYSENKCQKYNYLILQESQGCVLEKYSSSNYSTNSSTVPLPDFKHFLFISYDKGFMLMNNYTFYT